MLHTSNRLRRAAADPVTIAVVAIIAVVAVFAPSGGPGKKHFWQFWKKDPVAQTQAAQAKVDATKAAITAEQAKQLDVGHEASVATGAAIAAAQAKAAGGEIPGKELQTAKALNDTATHALDQALGPVAPARIRELEQMVANLNAGVAAGAKALELMQGTLDRTIQDKAALQAKLATVEGERDAAVQKEQAWAYERDAIAREYERLTFFGKIGLILGAVVAGYVVILMVRVRGLTNFGKDAVGMTEMLKGKLREAVPAEAYEKIKGEMREDWMTVKDGSAALVEKFKSQLRL